MTAGRQCPFCNRSLDSNLDPTTVDGGNFCTYCNLPLFWGPRSIDDVTPSEMVDREAEDLRRMPGVAGLAEQPFLKCWRCGEHVEPGASSCTACRSVLPEPDRTAQRRARVVAPCSSGSGATAAHTRDVPAWLLVTLGWVLAGLVTLFTFRAI